MAESPATDSRAISRDPPSAGARSLTTGFGDSSPYQPHTRCHSRFTSNARSACTARRLRPDWGRSGLTDRHLRGTLLGCPASARPALLSIGRGASGRLGEGCPQRRCDRRQRARSQHRRRRSPRHERRDVLSRLRSTPAASARLVIVQLVERSPGPGSAASHAASSERGGIVRTHLVGCPVLLVFATFATH